MKMEISTTSIALSIVLVTTLTWAWRILDWVWFRPKKLERYLRKQGLQGKPYRFLSGDLKENAVMMEKARSRPIDLSDDIARRVMPFLHQTIKNYGKNSFMWVGPTLRVNIMNPECIKDAFTKINEFQKVKANPLGKLLISGLVAHEGEKWANHRRIINPAFHLEKLKLMTPVYYQSCNEMINKWEKLASIKGTCELDVWPYLQTLASDVISRTAFGSNYDEGKRIFELLKEQGNLAIQVFRSVYIPGWRFLPTKSNKRMKAIDREIQASLEVIIDKRKKLMKSVEGATDDLLGILLESNFREIPGHGKNKNFAMSDKEVIDECKLFYLAGQVTTSALLVWTLILLGRHRNWQERAREEVLQAFGNNKPDFDGLNLLKVVTMILHEVLRLYPPVVLLTRAVHEEIKLGNLLLPAGVQIALPTILIHHDHELWGDDAFEFNPERFSEGVAKATKNQVVFFPFGWGPRICIGLNFALIEAKMALSIILQHFSFEISPSYIHGPSLHIGLQPQYGAQMILHK